MQEKHVSHYRTIVKAPINKVWDALSRPEIVSSYFFGSQLITTWEIGSSICFKGEWEGKPYEDKGIVFDYKPNKLLSFSYLSSWSQLPDSPENYLQITYHVNEVSEGTELMISQTNYDEEKAKHSEGNWSAIMESMKKLVE